VAEEARPSGMWSCVVVLVVQFVLCYIKTVTVTIFAVVDFWRRFCPL
jgi:uncharacterized membrane-anchored protein